MTGDVFTCSHEMTGLCNPSSQFLVCPGFSVPEKFLCIVGHDTLYNLQINDQWLEAY